MKRPNRRIGFELEIDEELGAVARFRAGELGLRMRRLWREEEGGMVGCEEGEASLIKLKLVTCSSYIKVLPGEKHVVDFSGVNRWVMERRNTHVTTIM